MLKLSVILCFFEKFRKGEDLIVCNSVGIIKPFKLQWVTIVEKSGAFCLAVD